MFRGVAAFKRLWSYALVIILTIVLTEAFHPLAAMQTMAQGGCQTFPATGKTVCGKFLAYWQTHGGLAQQGYPLSGEFTEVSDLNGQPYTVQYFERAVFEMHPENAAPNDVLLSQLGTFQFKRKYPNGEPSTGGQPPAPPAQPTPVPPAAGPKLEIADQQFVKSASDSSGRVIGYLKNTGSVDLGGVQIAATFKDAAAKIIGSSSDTGILMRPNDIYPFSISAPANTVSASLQLQYQPATEFDRSFYYRDYQVSDTNVVPPASYSSAKVVGVVKNTGTGTGNLIQVIVLVTDDAGKTLDVDHSFTELNELAPGQTSPFEVGLNVDQVPHYQVVVSSFKK